MKNQPMTGAGLQGRTPGVETRLMVALSGGHFAVDFASGSVPALIPFLTDRFDLGYALAALLLLAATVSSSLVQPLFGLWSDRRGAVWLIPGGTLVAAVGVGGAAVSPVYPLVVVLVFVGGLGVAAFPQAGERHVVLQHRRQRGVRTWRVRDRAAGRLARARRRDARDGARGRGLARARP